MEMPPLPKPYMLSEYRSIPPRPPAALYMADQMREYGESCARMAREEAAKVCEKLAEEGYGDWKHATPTDCAAAIRKG